jgi:hypothetical protein
MAFPAFRSVRPNWADWAVLGALPETGMRELATAAASPDLVVNRTVAPAWVLSALAWIDGRGGLALRPAAGSPPAWSEPGAEPAGPYRAAFGGVGGPHVLPVLLDAGRDGALGWVACEGDLEAPTCDPRDPHAAEIAAVMHLCAERYGFRRFPTTQVATGAEIGPSLGLPLLIATLAWWLDAAVPEGLCATGALEAEGLLPVEGLERKLRAARRWGYRRLLVIEGQEIPAECPLEVVELPRDPLRALPRLVAELGGGDSGRVCGTLLERAAAASAAAHHAHAEALVEAAWRSGDQRKEASRLATRIHRAAGGRHLSEARFETVHGQRSIHLVEGDITAPGRPFDLVVISSFRGSYHPSRGTIPGALLDRHDCNLEDLASSPLLDLRSGLGSWLAPAPAGMAADHLLVCEISDRDFEGDLPEAELAARLDDLLTTILVAQRRGLPVASLAMPVIGSGAQGLDADRVIEMLLPRLAAFLLSGSAVEEIWFVELQPQRAARLAVAMDRILGHSGELLSGDPALAALAPLLREGIAACVGRLPILAEDAEIRALVAALADSEARSAEVLRLVHRALPRFTVALPADGTGVAWLAAMRSTAADSLDSAVPVAARLTALLAGLRLLLAPGMAAERGGT